jgi:cyclophilin family peptidyl-prolyl cis-trans isomerase/HEAT repeat protein
VSENIHARASGAKPPTARRVHMTFARRSHPSAARGGARVALLVAVVVGVGGCGALTGGPSALRPGLPPSDELLARPDLQAVVDLQVARDGAALQPLLQSPDAVVRARVALALASVQDPTAAPALEAALADPSPVVRGSAAFALGQFPPADGGEVLARAFESEVDPGARLRMIEALGKQGGTAAVARLLEGSPAVGEAAPRALALARAGLREVRPEGAVDALLAGLDDEDAQVRAYSAYYFGRTGDVSGLRESAPRLRTALDAYPPMEPAAMDLVSALAHLGDVEEDAGRLARWIVSGQDWRIRVNAVGGVMSPRWLESPEIREALITAVDDSSEHVRIAAAESLALGMWSSPENLAVGEAWLAGPPDDWRKQAAVLPPIAAQGSAETVLEWTRRMSSVQPAAVVRGIEALGGATTPEVTVFLFEMAQHEDARVRAGATASLIARWARGADGGEPVERYFDLFRARLADQANLPAARAAVSLSHPDFSPLGAEALLEDAFRARRGEGDMNILVPIVESMGPASVILLREIAATGEDPLLRAAAGQAIRRHTGQDVAIGGQGEDAPPPTVDWQALAELGPTPRVRIETEKGEIVLRLFTEQAPLTVQSFAAEVERGSHDDTYFHRVEPNFVVQAGDFGMGDGTGGPNYRIRTEITQLPFDRGVIGMASAGRDTEGSQYYLTHSAQPHLELGYTAFGWIEAGGDVLDLIQQGDRIVRMTLDGN